ncbi:hypothetical protein JCM10908_003998 [Rhodotorula pacifica]|uniref:uncharacterized protein n=1 Tax=Rhodotorula pacifica TaxID=1495444 RepID=UPI0031743132
MANPQPMDVDERPLENTHRVRWRLDRTHAPTGATLPTRQGLSGLISLQDTAIDLYSDEYDITTPIWSGTFITPLQQPLTSAFCLTAPGVCIYLRLLPPAYNADGSAVLPELASDRHARSNDAALTTTTSLDKVFDLFPRDPRYEPHRPVLRKLAEASVARSTRRLEREAALWNGSVSALELLFSLVNGRLGEAKYGPPPFDQRSPVYSRLSACPTTVAFLLGLCSNPFSLPIDASPALRAVHISYFDDIPHKALAIELEHGAEANSLHRMYYYIRTIAFPTKSTLIDVLVSFLQVYPGNTPQVAALLHRLDAHRIDTNDAVALHYLGQTFATTPLGRALQDSDASSTFARNFLSFLRELVRNADLDVEKQQIRNLNKIAFLLHEFPELRVEQTTEIDPRDVFIGGLEIVIIASALGGSINSAYGGLRTEVDPTAFFAIAELVSDRQASCQKLDALVPTTGISPARARQISDALADAHQFWCKQPEEAGVTVDRDSEIGEQVYQHILANLQALRVTTADPNGPSLEVIAAKDLPAADLRGQQTATGPRAGRGPALGYKVDAAVSSRAETSTGWTEITAHVNLWSLQLRHLKILWAIIFLARYISIASPLLLRVQSAKVSRLVRTGVLHGVIDPESSDYDAFMHCRLSTDVAILECIAAISLEVKWSETAQRQYILEVGATAVLAMKHDPSVCSLIVCELDPGFAKYDPAVLDLVIDVIALVSAKVALARRALCEQLVGVAGFEVPTDPDRRKAFLRAARARTEELSLESGLEARLRQARADLYETVSALDGCRQLGAQDRRDADDPQAEFERRSAAAHLGVENRTDRLCFEGAPVAASSSPVVRRLLEPHFDHLDRLQEGAVPRDGKVEDEQGRLLMVPARLVQLLDLLDQHREAILDGLASPLQNLTLVAGGGVGTRAWVDWFLGAKEGVELARSASKQGSAGGPDWTDEARREQSEAQRAREQQRRLQTGLVAGEMGPSAALERLREDRARTVSVGYASRRGVFVSACPACRRVYFHQQNGIKSRCCQTAFVETRVLFTASLANLLDSTPLTFVRAVDDQLPPYAAQTVTQIMSNEPDSALAKHLAHLLPALPPAAAAAISSAPVWLPQPALERESAAAARDLLLISAATMQAQTVAEKIAMGSKATQHSCTDPATGKVNPKRTFSQSERVALPDNATVLEFGVPILRRINLALSDPHDALIAPFLRYEPQQTVEELLDHLTDCFYLWQQPPRRASA